MRHDQGSEVAKCCHTRPLTMSAPALSRRAEIFARSLRAVHYTIVPPGLSPATENDTSVIPATFSNNHDRSTTNKSVAPTINRKLGTPNCVSTLTITSQHVTRRSLCIAPPQNPTLALLEIRRTNRIVQRLLRATPVPTNYNNFVVIPRAT